MFTLDDARSVLNSRFGGLLRSGSHDPGSCQCCVEELRSVILGVPWTDTPDGQTPTEIACQRLNDAPWSSDAARTEGCLPLVLLSESTAAPGWLSRWIESIIRRILPIAMRAVASMPDHASRREAIETAAIRCEVEGTHASALNARDVMSAAAAYTAATAAAYAADAATDAYAADAAAAAAAAAAVTVVAAAYATDAYAAVAAAAYATDATTTTAATDATDATDAAYAAYAARATARAAGAARDSILTLAVQLLIEAQRG